MSDEEQDAHNLIPEELAGRIPALYATEKEEDPTVWIKLFTPDSNWTWYVTEYDPDERMAFGLVDGHDRELGYFSIEELEQIKGPLGLKIERDLHFTPQPLSQVQNKHQQRFHDKDGRAGGLGL